MALFNFKKKKETGDVISCGSCSSRNVDQAEQNCNFSESNEIISSIKVLGTGCKSCHELYENVKQAVNDLGLSTEVAYITDIQEIMHYGAMRMPVLVVNETVVSMGKVLKKKDIIDLLNGG